MYCLHVLMLFVSFFCPYISGRPRNVHVDMNNIAGNRLAHESVDVRLFGNPTIVSGKVGGALRMDGNSQYASLNDQSRECLGNVDRCRHGTLWSAWIKPGQLQNGMELMSTGANGLRLWYDQNKLRAVAKTTNQEWQLETGRFTSGDWQFVELSWSRDMGLALYINNVLVARDRTAAARAASDGNIRGEAAHFYLGRGPAVTQNARYANISMDDMEQWSGSRQYLLAFDYIQRGNEIEGYRPCKIPSIYFYFSSYKK